VKPSGLNITSPLRNPNATFCTLHYFLALIRKYQDIIRSATLTSSLGNFHWSHSGRALAMRLPSLQPCTSGGPTSEAVLLSTLVVLIASVLFAAILSGPAPTWGEELEDDTAEEINST
jgi:hypothetical protein